MIKKLIFLSLILLLIPICNANAAFTVKVDKDLDSVGSGSGSSSNWLSTTGVSYLSTDDMAVGGSTTANAELYFDVSPTILRVKGDLSGNGSLTIGDVYITNATASRLVATDANKKIINAITSANLASSISDETGDGAALFANGNIGVATGTSLELSGELSVGAINTTGTGSDFIKFGGTSPGNISSTNSTVYIDDTLGIATALTVNGAVVNGNEDWVPIFIDPTELATKVHLYIDNDYFPNGATILGFMASRDVTQSGTLTANCYIGTYGKDGFTADSTAEQVTFAENDFVKEDDGTIDNATVAAGKYIVVNTGKAATGTYSWQVILRKDD